VTANERHARQLERQHRSRSKFLPDTRRGAQLGDDALRALRKAGPLTFTAVPPHAGRRIALDRDLDGVLNGDR
jgi:hypothetical protein